MTIIGIDPGFNRCGFALVQKMNRNGKVIQTGLIETPTSLESEKRLRFIAHRLKAVISKFQPSEAAIERIFFFKNKKTALEIAEVVGMLKYILAEKKIKIFFYTPLQLKQTLTGYGKANKKQIYYMLKQLLQGQKIPTQDDEADALAVALTHIFFKQISKF
ncbi:MAG: crossover junction endodeoxyribonuclease RuvC [candidate division WOR-3 bacterium]